MKIRLQEIEFGANDPNKSMLFYNAILGLETSVDQEGLKVFNSGVSSVDFNTSTHYPSKITVTSFLTDNLQNIIDRLSVNNIAFAGPKKSHLGMITIEFNDPDGYLIKVNQPTDESPDWLTV
jgi:catechol 2,3-dioxygenase-like lactoylglutathione lyase family enzyme